MGKISQDKIDFDKANLSSVSSTNITVTGKSSLTSATASSLSVSTENILPSASSLKNNTIYFKSDGNLYYRAENVEYSVPKENASSVEVSSDSNYLLTDLIRTDESRNELLIPVLSVENSYNTGLLKDKTSIEVPECRVSYRVFDITSVMNPSLSSDLFSVSAINSIVAPKQLCIFKLFDLSERTDISAITITKEDGAPNNTYFLGFTITSIGDQRNETIKFLRSCIKTGFGYEITTGNIAEAVTFYALTDGTENPITGSFGFKIITDLDHSAPSLAYANIQNYTFNTVNLGTRFKFDKYKAIAVPRETFFVVEHFNLVVFQDKKNTATTGVLLVSYNPIFNNFELGYSANSQLYVENLPDPLIKYMSDQTTSKNNEDLAIGVIRIPFIANKIPSTYIDTTNEASTSQFSIRDTNNNIRRLYPCSIRDTQYSFKYTMFIDSGKKYINNPFSNLNQKLQDLNYYDASTGVLNVTDFMRSLICNNLAINSVNLSIYQTFAEVVKSLSSFERGTIFYEKLCDGEQTLSQGIKDYIGLRSYFYLGRDKEPVKSETLLIDSNFYSATTRIVLSSFTLNNISSSLMRNIRVPDQENSYTPAQNVELSLTGKGAPQNKDNVVSNILFYTTT